MSLGKFNSHWEKWALDIGVQISNKILGEQKTHFSPDSCQCELNKILRSEAWPDLFVCLERAEVPGGDRGSGEGGAGGHLETELDSVRQATQSGGERREDSDLTPSTQ